MGLHRYGHNENYISPNSYNEKEVCRMSKKRIMSWILIVFFDREYFSLTAILRAMWSMTVRGRNVLYVCICSRLHSSFQI